MKLTPKTFGCNKNILKYGGKKYPKAKGHFGMLGIQAFVLNNVWDTRLCLSLHKIVDGKLIRYADIFPYYNGKTSLGVSDNTWCITLKTMENVVLPLMKKFKVILTRRNKLKSKKHTHFNYYYEVPILLSL